MRMCLYCCKLAIIKKKQGQCHSIILSKLTGRKIQKGQMSFCVPVSTYAFVLLICCCCSIWYKVTCSCHNSYTCASSLPAALIFSHTD